MAFLRPSSGDVKGFKILFSLAIIYGIMSIISHFVMYAKFITPLGTDAPIDQFSEARAVQHIRVLSEEIDGRQVGRQGIRDAARYIERQLQIMRDRAGPNVRVEIEDTLVSGTFNMMFLGHSLSLGYRNLTNVIMRISSVDSKETDPSVLVNGHFDSPLGSPGAADCGSCVASMLEIARVIVDSGWVPPRPIVFLFNGAEELFMLGSHGFMTTHRWHDKIGAVINLEASGTGGLDLVCQSGPGSWPSLVYAQSAIYPMANSAAQDVFSVMPGDTDYRIFAKDFGKVPGLDIIFVLGGYFYHTSFDTVEKLLPGSIQARGDNLFSLIKAFTNSSELKNVYERVPSETASIGPDDDRTVFFDYLSWFLIIYPGRLALVLHSIPILIFFITPFLLRSGKYGLRCYMARCYDFIKGTILHVIGIILAVLFPVIFSIVRLLLSGQSMHWFAHPVLAFTMFIPCALIGLLIPRIIWSSFPLSQDTSDLKLSKETSDIEVLQALAVEARYWGAYGYYALYTLVYLLAGLNGGFLTFSSSVFMLPSWICYCIAVKYSGSLSLRSIACYVVPLIPCLSYAVYFSGFLTQFVIEKMGMIGDLPPPYGYFVQDIAVAATVGVVTSWCLGPLMPIVGHWLGRSSVLQFLTHLSVIGLALCSQFFPYSMEAPKRVVFQHTVFTSGASRILDSSYDFAVADSNSFLFVLKHAPEVAKELDTSSELSLETANLFPHERWMAIYPVCFLFSRSFKFHAENDDVLKQYRYFPYLSSYKPQTSSPDGSRKVYLNLNIGSLKEVWVAVLNITGPLSNWSLANNVLSSPERFKGSPPYYICRLSGSENWTFWLEASNSEDLRIEVAVLSQYLLEPVKKIKGLFPEWMDVTSYSSFMSSYTF